MEKILIILFVLICGYSFNYAEVFNRRFTAGNIENVIECDILLVILSIAGSK